jgi:hypothetical protein
VLPTKIARAAAMTTLAKIRIDAVNSISDKHHALLEES